MTSTYIDSVPVARAVTGRHPRLAQMSVGLARIMNWVAQHDGVQIWRIGSDYFIATCPCSIRSADGKAAYPATEISDPIRTIQDARDWLGY